MPLYLTRRRDTDAIRVIEAPNNRAVLMHLAAEMFDVALAKVETVGEDGEAEPVRRRRSKADPPAQDAQDEAQGAKPEAPAPVTPASADEPPAASEGLIEAEAARATHNPASGKLLFERMADKAPTADPLVDPETGEVFEKRETAPATEKE